MRLVFLREALRQWVLTTAIGQRTCTTDPRAHDVDRLPCESCGAAL